LKVPKSICTQKQIGKIQPAIYSRKTKTKDKPIEKITKLDD
jgi:hypothetical protein